MNYPLIQATILNIDTTNSLPYQFSSGLPNFIKTIKLIYANLLTKNDDSY